MPAAPGRKSAAGVGVAVAPEPDAFDDVFGRSGVHPEPARTKTAASPAASLLTARTLSGRYENRGDQRSPVDNEADLLKLLQVPVAALGHGPAQPAEQVQRAVGVVGG